MAKECGTHDRVKVLLLGLPSDVMEGTMKITRGPYSANVDAIQVAGRRQAEYHVVISRHGTPVYEQLEDDFEGAMRVAQAYIDWRLDGHTDTYKS